MPVFVEATVDEVLEERRGLQKLRVTRQDGGDGDRAYVLTQLIGEVNAGNRVILNVSAVELGLGTGGWHFVHWNLSQTSFHSPGTGHQMKLRYTSLQLDTGTAEEDLEYRAPDSLDGTPVVCTFLLSQAAMAAAAFKQVRPAGRVVLVMSDHNALPVAFSDLIFEMSKRGVVSSVISAGQSFGGDHEAVNVLSALGIAKQVEQADMILVSPGPGSLGTGSPFGFSTLGVAGALDDAAWYGGEPILAVRYSGADGRERHQGVSHHTATVLRRAGRVAVAIPSGAERFAIDDRHQMEEVSIPDVGETLATAGLTVTTMGRSPEQDPSFFAYSAAAGCMAAAHLKQ